MDVNIHKTKEQAKIHEGLRLKVYKCTMGYSTIGYGRNLDTNGISEAEADAMLDEDLRKVIKSLLSSGIVLCVHKDSRQAVIINMAFQMGVSGFLNFTNTIAAFNRKDYHTTSREMLNSLWARQTPNRAKELSEQMRTGVWQ